MTIDARSMPDREPGDGPAIDRSVLGEWLAGDEAAIDNLLGVFRDSIRAEQARMADVLARGDLDGYAAAVHRLRGAALSMGARGLAEAAAALYAAARARDPALCRGGMMLLATQIQLMAAEIPAQG